MLSTPRAGLGIAALLCCLAAPASADEPIAGPRVEAGVPKVPKHPKRPRRAEVGKAGEHRPDPAAGRVVGPASAPSRQDLGAAGSPATDHDAWTVSPKWSATSGGSSAPYGTRALVHELGTNPSETTGYGAGAEVQFHF